MSHQKNYFVISRHHFSSLAYIYMHTYFVTLNFFWVVYNGLENQQNPHGRVLFPKYELEIFFLSLKNYSIYAKKGLRFQSIHAAILAAKQINK